ncbi:hypothetical protein B0H11DRAFT_1938329 [Mycena galericulata]|nr:hypothetical protein B0H11DRAFT_1938329 [Mycena galericulata]
MCNVEREFTPAGRARPMVAVSNRIRQRGLGHASLARISQHHDPRVEHRPRARAQRPRTCAVGGRIASVSGGRAPTSAGIHSGERRQGLARVILISAPVLVDGGWMGYGFEAMSAGLIDCGIHIGLHRFTSKLISGVTGIDGGSRAEDGRATREIKTSNKRDGEEGKETHGIGISLKKRFQTRAVHRSFHRRTSSTHAPFPNIDAWIRHTLAPAASSTAPSAATHLEQCHGERVDPPPPAPTTTWWDPGGINSNGTSAFLTSTSATSSGSTRQVSRLTPIALLPTGDPMPSHAGQPSFIPQWRYNPFSRRNTTDAAFYQGLRGAVACPGMSSDESNRNSEGARTCVIEIRVATFELGSKVTYKKKAMRVMRRTTDGRVSLRDNITFDVENRQPLRRAGYDELLKHGISERWAVIQPFSPAPESFRSMVLIQSSRSLHGVEYQALDAGSMTHLPSPVEGGVHILSMQGILPREVWRNYGVNGASPLCLLPIVRMGADSDHSSNECTRHNLQILHDKLRITAQPVRRGWGLETSGDLKDVSTPANGRTRRHTGHAWARRAGRERRSNNDPGINGQYEDAAVWVRIGDGFCVKTPLCETMGRRARRASYVAAVGVIHANQGEEGAPAALFCFNVYSAVLAIQRVCPGEKSMGVGGGGFEAKKCGAGAGVRQDCEQAEVERIGFERVLARVVAHIQPQRTATQRTCKTENLDTAVGLRTKMGRDPQQWIRPLQLERIWSLWSGREGEEAVMATSFSSNDGAYVELDELEARDAIWKRENKRIRIEAGIRDASGLGGAGMATRGQSKVKPAAQRFRRKKSTSLPRSQHGVARRGKFRVQIGCRSERPD